MIDRTLGLSSRAKERSPLTNEELDDIVNSLHNITPHDAAIDWIAVRSLLAEVAHLSVPQGLVRDGPQLRQTFEHHTWFERR